MPTVGYTRQEYQKVLARWNLVRDCLGGESVVKEKSDIYLPRPNPEDKSQENKDRYAAYLARAVFYNVTKRTLDGLVGQVFTRDPILKLPPEMEKLPDNIDGAGVTLTQQTKKSLASTLAYGRCGLLCDYPPLLAPATKNDLDNGFVRPTITFFSPWDIVNWRVITVGARTLPSLIVLSESFVLTDDGFELKMGSQMRVLRLEHTMFGETDIVDPASLVYTVEIWRQQGQADEYVPYEKYTPVDSNGQIIREIPFVFIGALNNDPNIDSAPMYDLAALNIAHYRNSADYEESCFITGQPTPHLSGLTEHWVKEVLKNTVTLGSRSAILLPEGGVAGLLQPDPNSMPFEAMKHKEMQMIALGAKLVEQRQVQRTLGESQLEEASEMSTLATVANNVADAYEVALDWCAKFQGADASIIDYDINTDFPANKLDPKERAELIAEWQAQAISFTEMRNQLRKAGVATLDDQAALDELQKNPPPPPPGGNDPLTGLPRDPNKGRVAPQQDSKTQQ